MLLLRQHHLWGRRRQIQLPFLQSDAYPTWKSFRLYYSHQAFATHSNGAVNNNKSKMAYSLRPCDLSHLLRNGCPFILDQGPLTIPSVNISMTADAIWKSWRIYRQIMVWQWTDISSYTVRYLSCQGWHFSTTYVMLTSIFLHKLASFLLTPL